MRNPLSFRVETWLGVVFLLALTIFMVTFMFTALGNFNNDIDAMVVNDNNQKRDSALNKAQVKSIELQSQVGE